MPSFSEFVCPKCGSFWDTEYCSDCGHGSEVMDDKEVIFSRRSFKKETGPRISNRRTFVRGEKGV